MDIFSGFFDLDGDGEMSLGEQWMEYNVFRECTDSSEDGDFDPDFDCEY